MDGISKSAITLLQQLLPSRCLLCKQTTQTPSNICHYCRADLSYFDYSRFDNLLLRPDIADGLKRAKFDTLISLAPYQWPFNQWIGDFKFREKYQLCHELGEQFAQLLSFLLAQNHKLVPDVILPMPIHPARRFARGYNQSQLLAQVISQRLNLSLQSKTVRRIKATKAQSGLNNKMRRSNLKDAFAYYGESYPHVAIVDDVITTGATVNALCQVLKKHKIQKISVWALCATPKLNRDKKKRQMK